MSVKYSTVPFMWKLVLWHLRKILSIPEVSASIVSSTHSDSVILSRGILNLLSHSNYNNGFKGSQGKLTRCCWQEEMRNINSSSDT
jgi:hypothetical protein